MITIESSIEHFNHLKRIDQEYPIGFSINNNREIWGCTNYSWHDESMRRHLYMTPLLEDVITHALATYPGGGRFKLEDRCVGKKENSESFTPLLFLTIYGEAFEDLCDACDRAELLENYD